MIFVDTWAWLALAVKADQFHAVAKAQHQKFRKANRRYLTTDYVLSELVSLLYRNNSAGASQNYIQALLAKIEAGDYVLVHVSADQFRRAWHMRQKYHDKSDISFVDFTSMVVMQDLAVVDVFTGDEHFRQITLGFQLHP